jgi:hypothetical protein
MSLLLFMWLINLIMLVYISGPIAFDPFLAPSNLFLGVSNRIQMFTRQNSFGINDINFTQ